MDKNTIALGVGIFVVAFVLVFVAWQSRGMPSESASRCLEPQKDITAYEVAIILKYMHERSNRLLDDHPELTRHTAPCSERY